MAKHAALHDPEVLLDFRRALIDCLARARRALEGMQSSIQRTGVWLRDERAPQSKRQLLQAEARFGEAKIAYQEAKSRIGDQMARSHETEERAFLQARRQLEDVSERMQLIQRWLVALPRESAEGVALVRRAHNTVEEVGPRAVARLDEMIAGIERYLAASRGATTGKREAEED